MFKVVFLDNHLLVLNKEAGILTQRTKKNILSLEDMAKEFLKKKLSKKNVFLHPVHRLDKVVSGLVLFAKTSKALSRLNKELREKRITRKYLAMVEGYLKEKEGVLEHDIVRLNYRSKIVSSENTLKSKKAILKYRVIKEENKKSLLEIELVTGRYHQIRSQLSFIGHPILGDKKYGSLKKLDRVYLHSYVLEFFHPVKKEKLSFSCKAPFLEKIGLENIF